MGGCQGRGGRLAEQQKASRGGLAPAARTQGQHAARPHPCSCAGPQPPAHREGYLARWAGRSRLPPPWGVRQRGSSRQLCGTFSRARPNISRSPPRVTARQGGAMQQGSSEGVGGTGSRLERFAKLPGAAAQGEACNQAERAALPSGLACRARWAGPWPCRCAGPRSLWKRRKPLKCGTCSELKASSLWQWNLGGGRGRRS